MTDNNKPINFLPGEEEGCGFKIRRIDAAKPIESYQRKQRKTPRWILTILAVLAVMLVIGLATAPFKNSEGAETTTLFDKIKSFVLSGDRELDSEDNKYISILLMGVGGEGHDGPELTDTIILARINTETNQAVLFSLPRDLMANIPGYGWKRINNANAYGENDEPGSGPELLRRTLEETLKIPIKYYAKIDFKGFEKVIDSINGITIEVERGFTDDKYPDGPNQFQTISFKPGRQKMNGEQALIFARSRHGNNNEGSDFARAARQQKIILAVRSKLTSVTTIFNPTRLTNLYKSLGDSITANIKTWELLRLIDIVRGIDLDNIKLVVFDDSPEGTLRAVTGEDGAYLLIPKDGYAALRLAIVNALNDSSVGHTASEEKILIPEPKITLKKEEQTPPSVWVLNGTEIEKLAGRAAELLAKEGFQVIRVSNAPEQTTPFTRVTPLTAKGETRLPAITALLDPAIEKELPQDIKEQIQNDVDLVIILGPDAEKLFKESDDGNSLAQ